MIGLRHWVPYITITIQCVSRVLQYFSIFLGYLFGVALHHKFETRDHPKCPPAPLQAFLAVSLNLCANNKSLSLHPAWPANRCRKTFRTVHVKPGVGISSCVILLEAEHGIILFKGESIGNRKIQGFPAHFPLNQFRELRTKLHFVCPNFCPNSRCWWAFPSGVVAALPKEVTGWYPSITASRYTGWCYWFVTNFP